MGIIVYNGKSSKDYSILVEHPPGYEYPEKDLEITHVPGRNGDIVFDTGSYQNVDRAYEIAVPAIRERYEVMANKISEWLHSAKTYARLEDTYEPEYYRMALYKESNVVECLLRGAGRATINFNCKPQRFLKSGEEKFNYTNSGSIFNPTGFNSLPRIKLTTTGATQFSINSNVIQIKSACTDLVIDSNIQDCYAGTLNKNNIVTLFEFPQLQPGINTINFVSGITNLEIIPNWWTL